MKSSEAQFVVKMPFEINKEDNVFVSICRPFNICSQGDNESEAIENLKEAIELFITTCFEMGTFDQVMKECGFQVQKKVKKNNQFKQPFIDVPINFIAAHSTKIAQCPV